MIIDAYGGETVAQFGTNGRPISLDVDGDITYYKYNSNGRISEWKKGNEIEVWDYLTRCPQPSLRKIKASNGVDDDLQFEYWIKTRFEQSGCQPAEVISSKGDDLKFKYKVKGDAEVYDEKGRVYRLLFTNDISSPSHFEVGNVGKLEITYNQKGEADIGGQSAPELVEILNEYRKMVLTFQYEDCFCNIDRLMQRR